jgi:hypothetical protein
MNHGKKKTLKCLFVFKTVMPELTTLWTVPGYVNGGFENFLLKKSSKDFKQSNFLSFESNCYGIN